MEDTKIVEGGRAEGAVSMKALYSSTPGVRISASNARYIF